MHNGLPVTCPSANVRFTMDVKGTAHACQCFLSEAAVRSVQSGGRIRLAPAFSLSWDLS